MVTFMASRVAICHQSWQKRRKVFSAVPLLSYCRYERAANVALEMDVRTCYDDLVSPRIVSCPLCSCYTELPRRRCIGPFSFGSSSRLLKSAPVFSGPGSLPMTKCFCWGCALFRIWPLLFLRGSNGESYFEMCRYRETWQKVNGGLLGVNFLRLNENRQSPICGTDNE